MKTVLRKWVTPVLALILIMSFSGCSSVGEKVKDSVISQIAKEVTGQSKPEGTDSTQKATADQAGKIIVGLPQGFPQEIPFYNDAQIIESDNFNGNHYTVLYVVKADYDKVLDYYSDAFDLDTTGMEEGEAYFEGFDFGDILIQGLTIEETSDGVNVYMTVKDTSQDDSQDESDTEDTAGSGIMTYETAEEVGLDKNYPQDIVPIHPDAKVIGCSMVPYTSSGFVDLILPADAFEDAVSFYTEALSLKPKKSTTSVQESASFEGKIGNFKVSVLVSHLLSSGNDTLVQITVDEK